MDAAADGRLPAAVYRQQCPDFCKRADLAAFVGRLPLPWPTPPGTPGSPKPRYRSQYQPPDPTPLFCLDEADWRRLSPWDLVLRLVDFSGLRAVLAVRLYRRSARGRVPFDPVSLFLLFGWQLVNHWCRSATLRHLAEPRYAADARAFGFQPGVWPTEGGFRYFLTVLGRKNLTDLVVQTMTLVDQAGLIPAEVRQVAILSFDGMLHDAASSQRCSAVGATCYEPTSPDQPRRPCPAQAAGQRGCPCDTPACRSCCRFATPRDPEARFVWYTGSNHAGHPNAPAGPPASAGATSARGEGHFGYRSLPAQLSDPVQRVSWTLAAADLAPANGHEEDPAAALLRQVVAAYPGWHFAFAVGDSGLGYAPFLGVAYDLGVRRVVDLRADPRTDRDPEQWALRGYDDHGWPVCPFGFRLHPNGYDAARRRTKWCCRQACAQPPATPAASVAAAASASPAAASPAAASPAAASPAAASPAAASPPPASPPPAPPDCPFRDRLAHPFGLIKNVAKTFADGSLRLVRDLPFQSAAWKALYRRGRNAVEGRNARLERWGLKRLPVFGTPRVQATLLLADVWGNLLTLARLIQEATSARLALATPRSALP